MTLPARAGMSVSFDRAEDRYSSRWAFDAGIAWLVSNPLHEIVRGQVNVDRGIRGGEVYQFSVCYLLGEMELGLGARTFRPQFDVPFIIEVFDENERSPFLSYNLSLRGRWVDFPWNGKVYTTIGLGFGLSYSEKVPRMEYKSRLTNEDSNRTHLKVTLPLDISLAHPKRPHHQMIFFVAHQSAFVFGGGGLNAVGVGYRLGFR